MHERESHNGQSGLLFPFSMLMVHQVCIWDRVQHCIWGTSNERSCGQSPGNSPGPYWHLAWRPLHRLSRMPELEWYVGWSTKFTVIWIYWCPEWALPDQLVFATVSTLLWLASIFPETRSQSIDSIGNFSKLAVQSLRSENCNLVCLFPLIIY